MDYKATKNIVDVTLGVKAKMFDSTNEAKQKLY